jgi:hypothetical protein
MKNQYFSQNRGAIPCWTSRITLGLFGFSPWTHEISTQALYNFAVHGGVQTSQQQTMTLKPQHTNNSTEVALLMTTQINLQFSFIPNWVFQKHVRHLGTRFKARNCISEPDSQEPNRTLFEAPCSEGKLTYIQQVVEDHFNTCSTLHNEMMSVLLISSRSLHATI